MSERAEPSDLVEVETPRVPESTTYHGVEVVEDYRWLEDARSERTAAWTRAQDERTRSFLGGRPAFGEVRRRAEEILTAASTSYAAPTRAGGRFVVVKVQPPRPQPFLVSLTDLADASTERPLLDPADLDPDGTTAIDWFVPSPDGALVAVSLSSHGTEDGSLHVYEVATGEQVDHVLPRVSTGTAGGSLAWRHDSSGFWYTRHPSAEERGADAVGFFQEIWTHTLGEAVEDDASELAGVFVDERIVENELYASPDGAWVVDLAQRGDGGEYELFARAQSGGPWWQVATAADRVRRVAFGGRSLFLLSTLDAPRGQVLRLDLTLGATVEAAEVVVPASEVTVEGVAATDDRLWVLDMDGGPSGLRCLTHDGTPLAAPPLPAACAVRELTALGTDRVGYPVESWVSPARWFTVADADPSDVPLPTALDTDFPLDVSGFEVARVFATAKDGAQVPVNIVYPPGTRGTPAPVELSAYGGYGISIKPWFAPSRLLWLGLGGVHAVANIRGGGEYGEEWHHAGRLARKQTCFDDFAACARHLVDTGVTTPDRLAIRGGSNGGLLMGAVLTQHPGLARAVVAQVPVLDSLRVELHPNGAFNVTEFGTVEDPELFAAMYAYSPVHRVVDGTAYPAVLLTAGENDPRVDAYHAKKMAARLQAASSSGEPVLLLVERGGHGIGASLAERIEDLTFSTTFVVDRLGLEAVS